jgi:hypothetical protein
MRAVIDVNDLSLIKQAASMVCDWRRRTALRAAAQRGTAQVLRWQSRALRVAAGRAVAEADRLVTQSRTAREKRQI